MAKNATFQTWESKRLIMFTHRKKRRSNLALCPNSQDFEFWKEDNSVIGCRALLCLLCSALLSH